jgi:transcriptional regulator with XRE-family HTH domain
MPHHTKGESLLRAWLKRNGCSKTKLAARMRVSRPAVHYWTTGASRPVAHLRERLERITGIPRLAWYTVAEAKAVEMIANDAA